MIEKSKYGRYVEGGIHIIGMTIHLRRLKGRNEVNYGIYKAV